MIHLIICLLFCHLAASHYVYPTVKTVKSCTGVDVVFYQPPIY